MIRDIIGPAELLGRARILCRAEQAEQFYGRRGHDVHRVTVQTFSDFNPSEPRDEGGRWVRYPSGGEVWVKHGEPDPTQAKPKRSAKPKAEVANKTAEPAAPATDDWVTDGRISKPANYKGAADEPSLKSHASSLLAHMAGSSGFPEFKDLFAKQDGLSKTNFKRLMLDLADKGLVRLQDFGSAEYLFYKDKDRIDPELSFHMNPETRTHKIDAYRERPFTSARITDKGKAALASKTFSDVSASPERFSATATDMHFFDDSARVSPMPPKNAVDYFKKLTPKLGIDPERFGEAMERRAFTLAKATEETMVSRVQKIIQRRMETGEGVSTAPAEIDRILDELGVTPRNPQYSEMVVRTNMNDAYNTGSERQLRRSARMFPVWEYGNPDDGRSRPEHAARNGKYYSASIPFSAVRGTDIADLANCRCGFRAIDKFEWRQLVSEGAVLEDMEAHTFAWEAHKATRGKYVGQAAAKGTGEHVGRYLYGAAAERALSGGGKAEAKPKASPVAKAPRVPKSAEPKVKRAYGPRAAKLLDSKAPGWREVKTRTGGRGAVWEAPKADAAPSAARILPDPDKRKTAPTLPKSSAERDRLALAHQGLVGSVAKKWQGHGLDRDDLMGHGQIGLMKAIDKFDPGRGVEFSTYAVPWIKSEIQRAVEAHKRGGSGYGGEDDEPQLDPADYRSAGPAVEDMDLLEKAMKSLPPRHAEVLRHRYEGGLNFEEIGQKLGVTKGRAKQIHDAAIVRMRERHDFSDMALTQYFSGVYR